MKIRTNRSFFWQSRDTFIPFVSFFILCVYNQENQNQNKNKIHNDAVQKAFRIHSIATNKNVESNSEHLQ